MRKRRIGTAKFFTLLLLLYHTSAKRKRFKRTVVKRFFAYLRNAVRNVHIRQPVAQIKSVSAYLCQARREIDVFQRRAKRKGFISDGDKTFGKRQRHQRRTPEKRSLSESDNTVRQRHLRNGRTLRKRIVSYLRYSLGNNNFFDTRAEQKRPFADGSNFVSVDFSGNRDRLAGFFDRSRYNGFAVLDRKSVV